MESARRGALRAGAHGAPAGPRPRSAARRPAGHRAERQPPRGDAEIDAPADTEARKPPLLAAGASISVRTRRSQVQKLLTEAAEPAARLDQVHLEDPVADPAGAVAPAHRRVGSGSDVARSEERRVGK